MNFSNVARLASRSSQENVLASNRMDSSRMDRAKQRTILGVLTENEQHSRSFGQVSSLRTFLCTVYSYWLITYSFFRDFFPNVALFWTTPTPISWVVPQALVLTSVWMSHVRSSSQPLAN